MGGAKDPPPTQGKQPKQNKTRVESQTRMAIGRGTLYALIENFFIFFLLYKYIKLKVLQK